LCLGGLIISAFCYPDQKFCDLLHGFLTDIFKYAVIIMTAGTDVGTRKSHKR